MGFCFSKSASIDTNPSPSSAPSDPALPATGFVSNPVHRRRANFGVLAGLGAWIKAREPQHVNAAATASASPQPVRIQAELPLDLMVAIGERLSGKDLARFSTVNKPIYAELARQREVAAREPVARKAQQACSLEDVHNALLSINSLGLKHQVRPLLSLVQKIDHFCDPQSNDARQTTFFGVLDAIGPLPAEQRTRPLTELIKRFDLLPDEQKQAAFSGLLADTGSLPAEQREHILTALAHHLRKIPKAQQQAAGADLLKATQCMPVQHRATVLEALNKNIRVLSREPQPAARGAGFARNFDGWTDW